MTTDILTAFLERLQLMPYPIGWPGIRFEAPSEGHWIIVRLFPGEPIDMAWGDNSCHDVTGFVQASVGYRTNEGQVQGSRLADQIIEHFPKGLQVGPVTVRKRAYQLPVIEDQDRYLIPVNIPYRGSK